MNNHPTVPHLEKALRQSMEACVPSPELLSRIMSHIPEQQKPLKEAGRLRSPYFFVALTQAVALSMLFLAVYQPFTNTLDEQHIFYTIDRDVAIYEAGIDADDIARLAIH